ncbi:neural cell adhesion molecule 1-like [Dendronephthya gigantea]|uniref:neural cell adhesion molecule 1-like n=1 Tax=Dendronephthya gigantea TaxID=151771 RepID=UPI00106932AF|nr:neural cell adhesion molecule 1-like [Dendronephthya gigantea]
MANFIFGITALIVLNVLIASCKGKLSPPLDGDNLVFVNGSTAKIQWSVSDGLSEEQFRYWAFSSGDGSENAVELARIVDDGVVVNQNSPLDFEIEKPATLVLKNVSQNYNGEFRFILVTSEDCGQSDVLVRIAVLPTVTVSCSSQVIAKEGDNITCVCTEQGSNPPATLTWYKDGKQITDQQKERQTLSLSNIERDDNGTYRCEAKHLVSDEEESIEIIVQYKPTNTTITIEPATVSVGGTVTITCESYAHPEPVFTIEKNGTNVVFTSKEHTIRDVNKRDAATYRCVAENKHGMDSKSASLALADRQIQPAAEDKVRMVYIIIPSVIGAQIRLPRDGNRLIFVNGSTAELEWSFDDNVTNVRFRSWSFTSGNGSMKAVELATIIDDGTVQNRSNAFDFKIEKPATLVLNNVSQIQNGTYKFILVTSDGCVKPTVTVSCSSQVIVNEGDNFTCVCTEQGSNPPATVIWYKNNKNISEQGKERQALSFHNVMRKDAGTYECVAKSHLTDRKSIEIIVHYKPIITAITIAPKTAKVGELVNITCEFDGLPEPNIKIKKSGSDVVFTNKMHTIKDVKKDDAGIYVCVATNSIGSDSKSATLMVTAPTTTPTTASAYRPRTEWNIALLSLVAVGLFSYS